VYAIEIIYNSRLLEWLLNNRIGKLLARNWEVRNVHKILVEQQEVERLFLKTRRRGDLAGAVFLLAKNSKELVEYFFNIIN
jgi:hypothetical protein